MGDSESQHGTASRLGAVATLKGHTHLATSLAFAPDGKFLASGGLDGAVKLWEVSTGQCLATLAQGGDAYSVAFSPDGNLLAVGIRNNRTNLWDVSTRTLRVTFEESGVPGVPWHPVTFSPDGNTVASGDHSHGHSGTHSTPDFVNLWSSVSGKKQATLGSHPSWIRALAFSADGSILASGGQGEMPVSSRIYDGIVKLWDMTTLQELRTLTGRSLETVLCVSLSPDRTLVAAGAEEGAVIKLWNASTGDDIATLSVSKFTSVNSVAFSSDGRTLASAYGDGTVRLWEVPSCREGEAHEGLFGSAESVLFSPDGKMLAAGGSDPVTYEGLVKLWTVSD